MVAYSHRKANPMPRYTELSIAIERNRWLNGKLNPDRIYRAYVRGTSRKDCAALLDKHGFPRITEHQLKTYATGWGTNIEKPGHTQRGIWITRDLQDRILTPVWIEPTNEPCTPSPDSSEP